MGPVARAGLLLAWVAVLAILGLAVAATLRIGTDLRLFMPTPQTPAQRLLLSQVGEGPASRLLLLAIEGDEPEALAQASRALAAALRAEPAFRSVANGEFDAQAIPEQLLPYRYLLSARFDAAPLDAVQLRAALRARLADLGSPAASLVEPWVARDPTLESLALAEAWAPTHEPERIDEVWFDRAGQRALLVAETRAAAFDPDGQRVALDRLQALFARTSDGDDAVAGGERARTLLGPDARAHAGRSAAPGRLRQRGHARAAAAGLPPRAHRAARRAAAGQRRARGPCRGRPAVRCRARHHAGLRLHPDRRGAGLSIAPDEPPARRHRAAGERAPTVAHAGDRRGQHLHRLPRVPGLGRGGPGAARHLHHRRARGRGAGHPLPAAAPHRATAARLRRFAVAGAPRIAALAPAASAPAGAAAGAGRARRARAAAGPLLGAQPGHAHAGAAGPARARRRAARRTRRAGRALPAGDRRRRMPTPCSRRASACGRRWMRWSPVARSTVTTSPRATCPAPRPSCDGAMRCPMRPASRPRWRKPRPARRSGPRPSRPSSPTSPPRAPCPR